MTSEAPRRGRIGYGIVAVLAGHAAQVLLYLMLSMTETSGSGPLPTSFFVLIGFGVIQLVYVLPLLIFALFTSRPRMAATVFALAFLTFGASALFVAVVLGTGNLVP